MYESGIVALGPLAFSPQYFIISRSRWKKFSDHSGSGFSLIFYRQVRPLLIVFSSFLWLAMVTIEFFSFFMTASCTLGLPVSIRCFKN